MMKSTLARILIAIILNITFGGFHVSWAVEPGVCHAYGHVPHHAQALLQKYAERLRLDRQTLDEICVILAESEEGTRPLRQQAKDAKRMMHDLLSQAMPDEAAVMKQAEVIGGIQTRLRKQQLTTMLRVRALFTADQIEGLVQIWRKEGKAQRP